jgi:hypothetical protein
VRKSVTEFYIWITLQEELNSTYILLMLKGTKHQPVTPNILTTA